MITIDQTRCTGCGRCIQVCPAGALSLPVPGESPRLNEEQCVECGACVNSCPVEAIELIIEAPLPVPVKAATGLPADRLGERPLQKRRASVPERFKKLLAKPLVRQAVVVSGPVIFSVLKGILGRMLGGRPGGGRGTGRGGGRGRRFRRRW